MHLYCDLLLSIVDVNRFRNINYPIASQFSISTVYCPPLSLRRSYLVGRRRSNKCYLIGYMYVLILRMSKALYRASDSVVNQHFILTDLSAYLLIMLVSLEAMQSVVQLFRNKQSCGATLTTY